MPFSIIALFHRINIRKIKGDVMIQSKLSIILKSVEYIFNDVATRIVSIFVG